MRFGHMTDMNRRFALLGLIALVLAPASALAQVTPVVLQGAERAAGIAAANRSLNAIQRLQGRFVQQAPGGARSSGMFYLQRPGRLRFEYDPPASMLIVADGSVVAMRDTQMRTTERTNIRSTPLHLILGSTIDLERNARVLRVSRAGPWLLVTARDRGGQTDGQITLQFYGANAELRSWDVIDATGARTRITLSDVTQPASFDRGLFRLDDMLENNRPGRR
jgi:outer membrane lipoprotein-sorting protein